MIFEAKVRKWGNSMGIVLPKKIVEKQNLKDGGLVTVQLVGKTDLKDIFGIFKNEKINVRKLREESKRAWSKWD
jgi:antitoxin component of MazEF toxin-antitoxin module